MKYALHFILQMWQQQQRWLLIGAATSFLALFSAIALLGLSGWFITAAGLAGLAGAGLTFDFFRPSAGIRFLALFRTAARYGERLATHDATLRFLTTLRTGLFASVARAGNMNRRFRSSELLQRLTTDLDVIDTLYLRLLLPIAIVAMLLLVSTLTLAFISPSLVPAVIFAFFSAAILIYGSASLAQKSARRIAFGTEAMRVRTVDLINAQTDLLLSRGIDRQKESIGKASQYLQMAGNRLARIEVASAAGLSLISTALILAIVILSSNALQAGTMSSPVMAMAVIGGLAMLEVFAPLRRGAIELGRIAFSGRRLHDLSKARPEEDQRIVIPRGPSVAVLHMTFRYTDNAKPIFENFSFAARSGERVAIAGRSGCGKSTLLALIAGLERPDRGDILIRGDKNDSRPTLGFLTQETELFQGSIAENLRVAAPNASEFDLWHALEIVDLREKVENLDQRLAWRLGEAGNGFSGGERRRLALARLVLRNPHIWLMDEPTAGLDEVQAKRVLANLRQYSSGATWILSTHHDRELAFVDRVVRFGA